MAVKIEIIGMPNAGKSRLMKDLTRACHSKGHRSQGVGHDKGISGRFINKNDALGRQTVVLAEAVSELVILKDSSKADFIFIHRGPWDAIAFLNGLVSARLVFRNEANPLLRFAESQTKNVDLLILIKISTQVSLERRGKSRFIDPVVNKETLPYFERAYQDLEKKLPKGSIIINGTNDYDKNFDLIFHSLLSKAERRPDNEEFKN